MKDFNLVQGTIVNDVGQTVSAYCINNSSIVATLSAESLYDFLMDSIKLLSEPVFFFAEIPLNESEEKSLRKSDSDPFHYQIYYLDNCTTEVASAIVKRYGELLINDGLVRFGFGSHKTGDEIYFKKYQVIDIYGQKAEDYASCLEKHGAEKQTDLKTLWDCFSDDNPGRSVSVELNGESIYDMVESLTDAGLYKSNIVEE